MQSIQPKSRKLIVFSVSLAVIIAVASIFFATRRKPLPADRTTTVAINVMKSDLQGLVMAELATRRLRGRFVVDPEEAGHISSPGVSPPTVAVVDTGFTAVVTHKFIPGIRCAVGVFARNPIKRFAQTGEIVCE